MRPGGTPNSIVFERRYPDGTICAAEQQVKGKTLEFKTLWKHALGGVMTPILMALPSLEQDDDDDDE